jgi:hypothetical protein
MKPTYADLRDWDKANRSLAEAQSVVDLLQHDVQLRFGHCGRHGHYVCLHWASGKLP